MAAQRACRAHKTPTVTPDTNVTNHLTEALQTVTRPNPANAHNLLKSSNYGNTGNEEYFIAHLVDVGEAISGQNT